MIAGCLDTRFLRFFASHATPHMDVFASFWVVLRGNGRETTSFAGVCFGPPTYSEALCRTSEPLRLAATGKGLQPLGPAHSSQERRSMVFFGLSRVKKRYNSMAE